MNLRFLCFFFLVGMSGCMGGTLSKIPEADKEPDVQLALRSATASEATRLRTCLRAAESAQRKHLSENGNFSQKLEGLGLEQPCQGLKARLFPKKPKGFEFWAEIWDQENMARWSINQKGVLEEHLESNSLDEIDL
jgi:hypothetical protein